MQRTSLCNSSKLPLLRTSMRSDNSCLLLHKRKRKSGQALNLATKSAGASKASSLLPRSLQWACTFRKKSEVSSARPYLTCTMSWTTTQNASTTPWPRALLVLGRQAAPKTLPPPPVVLLECCVDVVSGIGSGGVPRNVVADFGVVTLAASPPPMGCTLWLQAACKPPSSELDELRVSCRGDRAAVDHCNRLNAVPCESGVAPTARFRRVGFGGLGGRSGRPVRETSSPPVGEREEDEREDELAESPRTSACACLPKRTGVVTGEGSPWVAPLLGERPAARRAAPGAVGVRTDCNQGSVNRPKPASSFSCTCGTPG
mmetsp:Transcript_20461/g.39261  ORF Transcript_20461/g.39261 Transcript_20461/m.39261 type:complete len:316 (-) Transcript_20461:42-989(-)